MVVVRKESRPGFWKVFVAILWVLIHSKAASRKRWRYAMRRCWKCPIYDRELKRCRPWDGHELGCGCYMPFKALVSSQGWATQHYRPDFAEQHCW